METGVGEIRRENTKSDAGVRSIYILNEKLIKVIHLYKIFIKLVRTYSAPARRSAADLASISLTLSSPNLLTRSALLASLFALSDSLIAAARSTRDCVDCVDGVGGDLRSTSLVPAVGSTKGVVLDSVGGVEVSTAFSTDLLLGNCEGACESPPLQNV